MSQEGIYAPLFHVFFIFEYENENEKKIKGGAYIG